METSLKLKNKSTPDSTGLFLCHNSLDKDTVRQIADALELETGTAFFLDIFAIPVGEAFNPWIEKSLESSSGCAIFLGANGWGQTHLWEAEKALKRYSSDLSYRLIPVALPGIKTEDMRKLGAGTLFQEINWADFTHKIEDKEALAKLLSALTGNHPSLNQGPAQLTPYQIRRDAGRWQHAKQAVKASILYKGAQLAEAERIIEANPDYVVLSEVQPFISAAHHEEHRRQRRLMSAISVTTIIVAILAFAAITAYFLAETRRRESVSRELAIASREAPRPDNQLLTALAAFDSAHTPEARGSLIELLENWRNLRQLNLLDMAVTSLGFSVTENSLLVGTSEGQLVRIEIDAAGKRPNSVLLTPQSGAITSMLTAGEDFILGREDGSIVQVKKDGLIKQLLSSPVSKLKQDQSISAFAAFGDILAIGGADGTLILINQRMGNETGRLDLSDELHIKTLAFDPLGKRLAIGGDINKILIIDVVDPTNPKTSRIIRRTEGDVGDVFAMSFDDEGNLISVSQTGFLSRFEKKPDGFSMGQLTNLKTDFVSVAKIEGKARLVALGDASGYIKVVDLFGFERLERQRGHGGPVTSLYIEKDGSFLSSGSGDGSIALWNLDVPEDLKQKHEKPPGVGEIIAMTSDKQSLISVAVSDGEAGIWRYENGKWLRELDLLQSSQEALGENVFTPQQSMNNAGESSEDISSEILRVAISPQSVAWLTRTGAILWQSLSKAADKPIVLAESGDKHPKALALAKEGYLVASLDEMGIEIRLFDVKTSNSLPYLKPPSPARTIAIDKTGKWLAVGMESGEIALYSIGNTVPTNIVATHKSAVNGLMFSDDGEFLTSYGSGGGGSDRSVAVIRLSDTSKVYHLDTRLPGGSATDMSLSKAYEILAVADHDGEVQLWSMSEYSFIGSIKASGFWIPSIYFDDASGILWVASTEGQLLSLDLRDDALNTLACQKANRNLNEAEWSTLRQNDTFERLCKKLK